jgi:hypothetical protein
LTPIQERFVDTVAASVLTDLVSIISLDENHDQPQPSAKTMSDTAIPVDFNACDEDGAVRILSKSTMDHLKKNGISLSEGVTILMTDGELNAEGTLTFRDGMWVAKITRWLDDT